MAQLLVKFIACDAGATALEYGLIGSFIFLAIVTVVGTVGTNLQVPFATIAAVLG